MNWHVVPEYSNPDAADSLGAESYLLRGMMREIETAAPDVWATIVDTYDHRAAIVGIRHSHARTERKRLRGGRQLLGIVDFAVTG